MWSKTNRKWSLQVFVTCWLVYAIFWAPFIVREHFPALTLAEHGSLNVAEYKGWTDDIFPGPRGGYYINNNPGASITAAIPLLLFRPILDRVEAWNQTLPHHGREVDTDEVFWRTVRDGRGFYFLLAGFVTAAFLMAPVTAGTFAYLCSRLIDAGVPGRSAAMASMLAGLATPLLFRAGHLNHNLLVADAGFIALLLLWDPHDRPLTTMRAGMAGLLAGYCMLCDYSGIVAIIVAGAYVWLRSAGAPSRFRILIWFAAGLVPGCVALMAYQAWAFGVFYRPSQHFMTPTAPTSHGYRGFDWPSPALAWALFFDPSFGIFAYCPALLPGLAAPFVTRVRYQFPRREVWLLLAYFGLFVVFCSANQYSWLQPLTGFRYLAPVVPGLALLAIYAAQAIPRPARIVLAAAACLQSFLIAIARENDLRLTLHEVWRRRFAFFWTIRLQQAGMPAGFANAIGIAAFVILALVLTQAAIALRHGRNQGNIV